MSVERDIAQLLATALALWQRRQLTRAQYLWINRSFVHYVATQQSKRRIVS